MTVRHSLKSWLKRREFPVFMLLWRQRYKKTRAEELHLHFICFLYSIFYNIESLFITAFNNMQK